MVYATCHPDRKHKARGLCSPCYLALPEKRQQRLGYRKKYNAKYRVRMKEWWRAWYEKNGKDYYRKYNKDPINKALSLERGRLWRERNKSYRLERSYGITFDDKLCMYRDQDMRCAACRDDVDFFDICVDHDHATGAVRGLLCGSCNRGLGAFKDDLHRVSGCLDYLMLHRLKAVDHKKAG